MAKAVFKMYYRALAGWLIFYDVRKKKYINARDDILYGSGLPLSARVGHPSHVTDKTSSKGLKLADLDETGRWLRLVNSFESTLSDEDAKELRQRRECRYVAGMRYSESKKRQWHRMLERCGQVADRWRLLG